MLAFSLTGAGKAFWRGMFRASGFQSRAEDPLQIHVLDVGKADALVLTCEGHTAVLDGGTAADGGKVTDYILRNGLGPVELLIASHPDGDHIGGLAQVAEELGASAFIRGAPFPEAYDALRETLRVKDVPERVVTAGEVFSLGGAKLEVLGPVGEYAGTNDASLVLKLTYDGFSALFCGDIEARAEEDLLASGEDLRADLIKVPHHGSRTSSSQAFLEAVGPKYAVISVGEDNNELPNDEVLDRLDAASPYVFRTDLNGTVVFGVTGGQVTVYLEK